MSGGRKAVAVGVAALAVAALWHECRSPVAMKSGAPEQTTAGRPPVVVEDGLTIVRDSGFDSRYGAADGSAREDLELLAGVWEAAMLLVKDHDRFPLPDNAAITAFLQGRNPHRVAWIRPGHPAVGAAGELLDRWGSPVFFHRESAGRSTFRSAGPDREMWTDDDLEWP
jgi:hypothetical protein